MAKYVKLLSGDGVPLYVNADNVDFIGPPPPPHNNRIGLIGVYFGPNGVLVKGSGDDIAKKLAFGPFLTAITVN